MPSRFFVRVALALALCAWLPLAGANPINYGAADAVSRSAAVATASADITELVGAGRDADAASALIALGTTDALAAVAREAALHKALLDLASQPVGPRLIEAAKRLATRPPQIFVNHMHSGRARPIPIFDAGAAARHALRQWQAYSVTLEASRAFKSGSQLPINAADRQAYRSGLAAAVRAADKHELVALRDRIATALDNDPDVAPAALELGIRLADPTLVKKVAAIGDGRSARQALDVATTLTDPAAASGIIDAGLARADTASSALFALGRRAASEPAALELLISWLGDEQHGGSAAAALARLDDPSLIARLGALLEAEQDRLRATRLALALRLNGSDAARVRIAAFATAKGPHAELRAMLREVSP